MILDFQSSPYLLWQRNRAVLDYAGSKSFHSCLCFSSDSMRVVVDITDVPLTTSCTTHWASAIEDSAPIGIIAFYTVEKQLPERIIVAKPLPHREHSIFIAGFQDHCVFLCTKVCSLLVKFRRKETADSIDFAGIFEFESRRPEFLSHLG